MKLPSELIRKMDSEKSELVTHAMIASCAFILSLTLMLGSAGAEDKTYVMKISGPTINDTPHLFMRNFAAAVERDWAAASRPRCIPLASWADSAANRWHAVRRHSGGEHTAGVFRGR